MITLEKLEAFGADTKTGLTRCVNKEDFYLRLVGKAAADFDSDKIKNAISAGDIKGAFEIAHSMKGVSANLALDPITKPVSAITEELRGKSETDFDFAPLLSELKEKENELKALCL